ncbi:FxLD family lantipeptide [Glycomyces fuscus]|nr:FxLD family lantipeptide [Glycomyces fuscus]
MQDTQDVPRSDFPFALDIRLIEGEDTTPLINMTDDGCGASCPNACATSASD